MGRHTLDLRRSAQIVRRHRILAVVAMDDPKVTALALVSLAMSYADEGRTVVLATLAQGPCTAALLAGKGLGVPIVGLQKAGITITLAVFWKSDDVSLAGAIGRAPAADRRSEFTGEVASAYSSAELLLTPVTLDPALGADDLGKWAPNVVALVIAGRSSCATVQAAGELIWLGGLSVALTILALSAKGFNGFPIDSGWLAAYFDFELVGVSICTSLLIFVLISGYLSVAQHANCGRFARCDLR